MKRVCSYCGNSLTNANKCGIHKKCGRKQHIEKNKDRLQTCKICSEQMLDLSHHIRSIHNMTAQEYKDKFNVDKLYIPSEERIKKIRESNTGFIWTKEAKQKVSKTLRRKYANGEMPTYFRTKEWRQKISTTKQNFSEERKKEIGRKLSKKLKGKESWSKGLNKNIDERLKRTSENVKKTMINNPKLQFNYRLAQKRKNNVKFGGEERFEWCLKQAGYVEGVDYKYNKSVKVFDVYERKKYRYFYPDFLLFDKYVFEIDGVCHDSIEAKEYDDLRTRILNSNGYRVFFRFKHDNMMNKSYLSGVIEFLEAFKKSHENEPLIFNLNEDVKNAIRSNN